LIELLNYLHELPPNETLSGLNQKISSSTESVIEVLDKLRQERTTTTTTISTTTAATTTTTVSIETTTLATTTTIIESETSTQLFPETEEIVQNTSDKNKPSLQLDDEKKSLIQSEKEIQLNASDPEVEKITHNDSSSTDMPVTEIEDKDVVTTTTTTTTITTTTSNPIGDDSKFSGVDDESDLAKVGMEIDDTQTEKSETVDENKTDKISSEEKITDRIEPLDDLTDVEPIDSFGDLKQPITAQPTPKTPDLKSLPTSVKDDHQSQELNVTNNDKGDELTLTSISRACSNASDEGWSCNEEGSSVDVVMIASVTVAIVVIIVIVSVVLSIWLCKKSHHRKNVYATMEEEQPKDFTKAGPPVILQDELSESINKPRLYLRNSDKVTEL